MRWQLESAVELQGCQVGVSGELLPNLGDKRGS
jgi:hypothetical protein